MSQLFSWWLPVALRDRQSISDLAGSASFTIWLFAQSPQLLENYRRGSVEGLSPVFLVQWMLGDATNLVGCVLTGQLPFQIAVATYFCCVDLCIMVQYLYYWRKARATMRRSISAITRPVRSRMGSLVSYHPAVHPFAIAPTETSELLPSASSSRRQQSRGSRSPTLARAHSARPPISRRGSEDMEASFHSHTATYRALRDAAMSVAQLADEAARRREPASYFDSVHSHYSHHRHHHHHHHHSHSNQHHVDDRTDRPHRHYPSRRTTGGASMSRSSSRHSASAGASTEPSRRQPQANWTPVTLSPTNEARVLESESEDDEVSGTMLQSTTSLQSHASTQSSASAASSAERLARSRVDLVRSDLTPREGESSDRRGRDMTRTAIRLGLVDKGEDSSSPTPSDGTAKCAGDRRTPSVGPPAESRSGKETQWLEDAAKTTTAAGGIETGPDVSASRAEEDNEATPKRRVDRSGSRPAKSRARSSHSIRRGFGMALMGLMLVVALAEGPDAVASRSTSSGELGAGISGAARHAVRLALDKIRHPATLYFGTLRSVFIASPDGIRTLGTPPLPPAPPTGPTWDRIIGRMSAWTCTVLYMTSRLPQIWENYLRRSVAGLSILLFVAAFMGNLTYSISILVSPAAVGPGRREYLQECLPFLLGSGGTLIFDFIIVVQWWMWSGKSASTTASSMGAIGDGLDDGCGATATTGP
ncbi:uncharacterized protein PSFLO_03901 [Pseudozyma flocculosa]|uniref:Uncharacterized protein n=1 Tax=Pseudozyma flocculosa TaxID=84751 RepID=A0A5C3F1N1_9BASI|nr:uncharacterized protein PSFLO_03901 [Pseudozyma flocculosa]